MIVIFNRINQYVCRFYSTKHFKMCLLNQNQRIQWSQFTKKHFDLKTGYRKMYTADIRYVTVDKIYCFFETLCRVANIKAINLSETEEDNISDTIININFVHKQYSRFIKEHNIKEKTNTKEILKDLFSLWGIEDNSNNRNLNISSEKAECYICYEKIQTITDCGHYVCQEHVPLLGGKCGYCRKKMIQFYSKIDGLIIESLKSFNF